MVEYNLTNLISVNAIYDFFKNSDYTVESDMTPFPISELIEKQIEGETWLIVNQTNLMILIINAKTYNQKTYRNKINNYLKELAGMKLIFYTEDFKDYHLTLIYDGIFTMKFNPTNPEMLTIRVFEALESGEDLFDFTEQDINFILLKRELTANALKESIREGDNSSVKITFQDGGLKLIGEGSDKIVIAHEDAPIKDLIVDVKIDYNKKDVSQSEINSASTIFEEYCEGKLKLYCLITSQGIIYHWLPYSISGFIGYKNQLDENVMDDVLESLIAQVSVRTAFNSLTFHQQFGTFSPFFILGIDVFNNFFIDEQEKIKIMYEEWKIRFSKVYQVGDLDQELFVKHAFLSLLIKTVLISKFVGVDNQRDDLQRIIEIFEERGVPIFLNDFFQWTSEEIFVQKEVFTALHNAKFIIDDLFRTIYQEMVSPATRHALGEFYTPSPLAQRMVDEVYKFGQYVLDPACGSGTFLVEILHFIHNSNKSTEEKIEAVSKIYGFDVNPIAVLVARSNLLLLTNEFFKDSRKISINIYLADSLNPINEFTTILEDKKDKEKDKKHKISSLDKWHTYGEVERFNMSAINDSLVINIKFFKYTDQFGDLLKELDKYLSKDLSFDNMLKSIYNSVEDNWLDELCEGSSNETLRNNFEHMAKKLYDFVKKDKNHIWAYLLYNAIGVRKMKETMDGVDLIIGNPPWLTIHDILSYDYKNNIKTMSENLGIYVGGKQSPHADLCSVFFYKTSDLYLKKNGRIFFVTTTALETGSQHSKFRMFKGFKDINIWKFEKDVFKIRNICISARYGEQPIVDRLNIRTKLFKVSYQNKKWDFDIIKEEIYVPNNIKHINKDLVAKRLIPKSKIKDMLPINESYYKDKFYQGASLVPRNLIFVNIKSQKENSSIIIPNSNIGSKKPWKFIPYEEAEVENQYIFKCAKSTELVPFLHLFTYNVFLPIELNDYSYHLDYIKPKSQRLFNNLKKIYREIQERDQRQITDLWQNINYLNKLTNSNQKGQIKVVYPASGKYMKSAIIKDENVIIDHKLYYFIAENLEEAYYLCTILNSRVLTEDLKYRSSTGFQGKGAHIHKRVLDYPIQKYNENNKLHKSIVKIRKKIEEQILRILERLKETEYNKLKNKYQCKYCGKTYSKSTFERNREIHEKKCEKVKNSHKWSLNDWIDCQNLPLDGVKISSKKVQNSILNDTNLKDEFDELDELVIQLLNSEIEND